MKETFDIGDAFGKDATPEEDARVMREVEAWLQEARAAKRRHKIIDKLAYAMLYGYIAGVVLAMVVANIWPVALIVGLWVIGGSFVLNIALVVAEVVVNRRRQTSIIPTTGQDEDLTTHQK